MKIGVGLEWKWHDLEKDLGMMNHLKAEGMMIFSGFKSTEPLQKEKRSKKPKKSKRKKSQNWGVTDLAELSTRLFEDT